MSAPSMVVLENTAPIRYACEKLTLSRVEPVKLQLMHWAESNFAPLRLAPFRLNPPFRLRSPTSTAPLKLAPLMSLAAWNALPDGSWMWALLNFAFTASTELKSGATASASSNEAPLMLAATKLAPLRSAPWKSALVRSVLEPAKVAPAAVPMPASRAPLKDAPDAFT